MNPLSTLRDQFQTQIELREKRPGIQQLFAPLYHEDGDMVDLFVDLPLPGETENGARKVRVSDHGLTLMRLSYTYDLDTPNKERIFARMLAENHIEERDGRLSFTTIAHPLFDDLSTLSRKRLVELIAPLGLAVWMTDVGRLELRADAFLPAQRHLALVS